MNENLQSDAFEEFLKKSLDRLDQMPDDKVWDNIDQQLTERAKSLPKYSFLYNKKALWLLVLLFLSTATSIYYFNKSKQLNKSLKIARKEILENNMLGSSIENNFEGNSISKPDLIQNKKDVYLKENELSKTNIPTDKSIQRNDTNPDQIKQQNTRTISKQFEKLKSNTPQDPKSKQQINELKLKDLHNSRARLNNEVTQSSPILIESPIEKGIPQSIGIHNSKWEQAVQFENLQRDIVNIKRDESIDCQKINPPTLNPLSTKVKEISSLPSLNLSIIPRITKRVYWDLAAVYTRLLIQNDEMEAKPPGMNPPDPRRFIKEEKIVGHSQEFGLSSSLHFNNYLVVKAGILNSELNFDANHSPDIRCQHGKPHPGGSPDMKDFDFNFNLNSGSGEISLNLRATESNNQYTGNDPLEISFKTHQHSQYLSIPWQIGVEKEVGKFQFQLFSGFKSNILLTHSVTIDNIKIGRFFESNSKTIPAQQSDLRPFSVDWLNSAQLGYFILPHIGIYLEPSLSLPVLSKFNNPYLKNNSIAYGISTGIKYSF